MHYTEQSDKLNTHTPELTLTNKSKILYMTHLALGDYVYQGAFLKALADAYSGLQIDVWIDDCRSNQKSWHSGRNSPISNTSTFHWLAGRVISFQTAIIVFMVSASDRCRRHPATLPCCSPA